MCQEGSGLGWTGEGSKLLREQLELISRGVEQAVGRDAAAADGMLSQSHYLRQKFQGEAVGPIELGERVRLEK